MDLTPLVVSEDEKAEACDLRTNPPQEGGHERRRPSSCQAQAQAQVQLLGPWQGRYKKTGTLLLMAEKHSYTC